MLLRDLIRGGAPIRVMERSGSRGLKPWDRIATRVITQRKAAGDAGGEVAELPAEGHAARLGSLETVAGLPHMPAGQSGVRVLCDAEQPDLAVLGGGDLGGIDRSHDDRRGGDNVPHGTPDPIAARRDGLL